MAIIGLILAAAAGGCCAYLAGLSIERWVIWPKPHSRTWAILIVGILTVVNVVLVDLAFRLGMPISLGALYTLLQVQGFFLLLVLCVGLGEWLAPVSTPFIAINIGALAVQLVGMRPTLALPDMTVAASLWWSGSSFVLLSRFALQGMHQGRLQRVAMHDGGLVDHV